MSLDPTKKPSFAGPFQVMDDGQLEGVLPGLSHSAGVRDNVMEAKGSSSSNVDGTAGIVPHAASLVNELTAVFLQPFGEEFSCEWQDERQSGQYLETDAETLDTRNAKLFFSKVSKIVQKERPDLQAGMNIRARILRTRPGMGRLCAVLALAQSAKSPDAQFVGDIIRALSKEVAEPTASDEHEAMLSMAAPARGVAGDPAASIEAVSSEPMSQMAFLDKVDHLQALDRSAMALVLQEAPALSTALARSTEGRHIHVLQGESELAREEVHVKEKSMVLKTESLPPAIYKFCGMDREKKSVNLMTYEGKKKSFTVSYEPQRSGEELEQIFNRLRRVGPGAFERDDTMADDQGAPLIEAKLRQLSKGDRVSSHSIDAFEPVLKSDSRLLKK